MHFFLKRCKFIQLAQLNPLEISTMYISAAMHDIEHPGTNNLYQISMKTDLAILYNDKSPLENHHSSKSFRIMFNEPNLNIF